MTDLVFLQRRQALTTSLKVAERFEKNHRDVLKAIGNLTAEMASVSQSAELRSAKMFQETTYQAENGGRRYPMYLMNRDGFTLLAMGFTGAKALQFKLDYINAFNTMEQILLNQQNEQWRAMRTLTKESYRTLTDAIKKLYLYAVEHGTKQAEGHFYSNFATLINKTLGIKKNSRDTLEIWQLAELEKLQFIAKTVVEGEIAKGVDYHLPYYECKDKLEVYKRLSFIDQRQLPA